MPMEIFVTFGSEGVKRLMYIANFYSSGDVPKKSLYNSDLHFYSSTIRLSSYFLQIKKFSVFPA